MDFNIYLQLKSIKLTKRYHLPWNKNYYKQLKEDIVMEMIELEICKTTTTKKKNNQKYENTKIRHGNIHLIRDLS